MKFLSGEWFGNRLTLAAELPTIAGASARLQHQVTTRDGDTLRYYDIIEDGRLLGSALGVVPDADVVLDMLWTDELAFVRGQLDPVIGVLQGRIVITGDENRALALLPILQTPQALAIQRVLDRTTEDDHDR